MEIINNFMPETVCKQIVELCETEYKNKFRPRNDHGSGVMGTVRSKFSTLYGEEMGTDLLDLIFFPFPPYLHDVHDFVQIQRYYPGEYIAPHTDIYDIEKLHLVFLTTSEADGLTYVEDGVMKKIRDEAGTLFRGIGLRTIWHWVDPVIGPNTRYSLVIGE